MDTRLDTKTCDGLAWAGAARPFWKNNHLGEFCVPKMYTHQKTETITTMFFMGFERDMRLGGFIRTSISIVPTNEILNKDALPPKGRILRKKSSRLHLPLLEVLELPASNPSK